MTLKKPVSRQRWLPQADNPALLLTISAQILVARSPGRLKFVRLRLIWSSVWDLLHGTLLAPSVLGWVVDFWENCLPTCLGCRYNLVLRLDARTDRRTDGCSAT
jgi:hypothetical protein